MVPHWLHGTYACSWGTGQALTTSPECSPKTHHPRQARPSAQKLVSQDTESEHLSLNASIHLVHAEVQEQCSLCPCSAHAATHVDCNKELRLLGLLVPQMSSYDRDAQMEDFMAWCRCIISLWCILTEAGFFCFEQICVVFSGNCLSRLLFHPKIVHGGGLSIYIYIRICVYIYIYTLPLINMEPDRGSLSKERGPLNVRLHVSWWVYIYIWYTCMYGLLKCDSRHIFFVWLVSRAGGSPRT